MGTADFEAVVLHHVELVGERVDRLVAEPVVIVPAEMALVERDRAVRQVNMLRRRLSHLPFSSTGHSDTHLLR
jgi:hypothetical protein